uniref:tRNA methyltransferase 10 homolog B n=1 Tax=Poecilia reticulata TaxID=8081 RepID=A0A3P9N5H8_POERE
MSLSEKQRVSSETCETDLDGVSELMDLLRMDLDPDGEPRKAEGGDAPCSSKNVLRKQRHWERQLAAKKSKRKEEKQRRRLNRAPESGEDRGTSTNAEDLDLIRRLFMIRCSVLEGGDADAAQFSKRVMKAITKERLAEARSTGRKLCVDLSMTDCMSDKEISRLAGQLRRLYGSNKKATRPFHLFLTDLREDSRLYQECVRMNDGFLGYAMEITEESCLDLFPSEAVVYLTPDAQEALQTVDADTVYVLGGLVDESIQKKLSLSRAAELSVRTARLPVDECMVKKNNAKNFHSKILAVNQVFDILLMFSETGSWTQALQTWFPAGKGYVISPENSARFPVEEQ